MDALHRLLRFGRAAKERTLPIWKSAALQSEPALQWLKLEFGRGLQWLKARPRGVSWAVGISIAFAFLVFSGATAAGAALLAWAALGQAATASERHQEQTNADRQRRITESFSKAVEQLWSDKLEVRLGGIYSLERISKKSPDDYWTVMENLTAFVRERSRRNEAERTSRDLEQRISRRAYFLWSEAGQPDGRAEDFWAEGAQEEEFGEPTADIAAVLTVIKRRSEQGRRSEQDPEREGYEEGNFLLIDLSGAILKRYNLELVHLEVAYLRDAQLAGANLMGAHLDWADFSGAHLEGARLGWANLTGANLTGAHLKGAHLTGAHLTGAHLERADLSDAVGLLEAQLRQEHGDARRNFPKE